jgi:UDP-N-acetylmuramate dehydrogenase
MLDIKHDVALDTHHTFRLQVVARHFVEVSTIDQLKEVLASDWVRTGSYYILGGGSNVLFTKDYEGLLIKVSLRGMELTSEDAAHYYAHVAAGEQWHAFVLWCIARGYAGVENMSLIPGQIGAGPIQNIGAYGAELKDVCHYVDAMEIATGEVVRLTHADCAFGYRDSIFKQAARGKYVITAVGFKLHKQPRFNIQYGDIKATLEDMNIHNLSLKAVSDAVIKIRSSKLPDPTVIGNAGSFFKNAMVTPDKLQELLAVNPVMPHFTQPDGSIKIPAGWLIEQCGWKGKRVGNTGAYERQALVLVNYGGATGPEVYDLALAIQQSVLERFGVVISPEVNLV